MVEMIFERCKIVMQMELLAGYDNLNTRKMEVYTY